MGVVDPAFFTTEDLGDGEVFGEFEPLPAGTYLFALDSLERRKSKKGREFWRIKFEVVEGQCKGRTMSSNFSVDLDENVYAKKRWYLLTRALGISKSFDTDDMDQIFDLFYGKVFKATIKRDRYTNDKGQDRESNDFEKFIFDLDPRELQIKKKYQAEVAQHKLAESSESWRHGAAVQAHATMYDDIPAPTDDDIPF